MCFGFHINKTDHHNIIEILLEVVLNTINQTLNWRHFKKYEITNGNKFNLIMQNKREHNIVFSLNENIKKCLNLILSNILFLANISILLYRICRRWYTASIIYQ